MRAGTTGLVAACTVPQAEAPEFGALVRVPLEHQIQTFGLIYDIRISDDGLVTQLATSPQISPEIVADNRLNRNVPVEMSILSVGMEAAGEISYLLPPRPPLSLERITLCDPQEVSRFTGKGSFGYFRHILRGTEFPPAELLASHLKQAARANLENGNPTWLESAEGELISLLRNDYPTLMQLLNAVRDL